MAFVNSITLLNSIKINQGRYMKSHIQNLANRLGYRIARINPPDLTIYSQFSQESLLKKNSLISVQDHLGILTGLILIMHLNTTDPFRMVEIL